MPSYRTTDAFHDNQAAASDHEALLAELFDLDVGAFTDDVPFYEELAREEKAEVLSAIRGGEGYQSLWEK